MKSVAGIINDNIRTYAQFEYYSKVILPKIEKNIYDNPDICIEACKSLLEGLSKTILKALNSSLSDRYLDSLEFPKLIKNLLSEIAKYNEEIEEVFVTRVCSVIHIIAETRNTRGDISHGKLAPKQNISSTGFSTYIQHITEATAFYVLNEFYRIESDVIQIAEYEDIDNAEYNSSLDERYPMPGKLLYSRALYEQDYSAYESGLFEFRENKKNETSFL